MWHILKDKNVENDILVCRSLEVTKKSILLRYNIAGDERNTDIDSELKRCVCFIHH